METSISKPKINQKKEVKQVIKATSEIKLIADNMSIISKEAQIEASDLIKQIKGHKKTLTEMKEFFTKPSKMIMDFIRGQIKDLMNPLDEMEKNLKEKLITYQEVLEGKARVEREKFEKKTEKAIENDKPLPVEAPIEAEKKVKSEESTLSYKTTWKFEIEDSSKVPAEYMIPDEVKIGKVVRAGIREILGVRIYSIKEPSIR